MLQDVAEKWAKKQELDEEKMAIVPEILEQYNRMQKCKCAHEHSKHVTFFYKEANKDVTYCQGNDEIIRCSCNKFEPMNPFEILLLDVDRYIIQMHKLVEKMQWVLLNLKFFRNYSDKYLPFAWWYYINHWDIWHEPCSATIYQKLDDASDLTRARRKWRQHDREHGTELYKPFKPKAEEEHIYRQYQMHEYFAIGK